MATKRFEQQLRDWQVLHDNLVPHLTDMPQLAADHTALAGVLTQARDLENKQEAARSAFRDVNQQRRDLRKQGNELRLNLADGLKAALGGRSEKLIEFGVKPRPRAFPRQQLSAAEKAERAAARAAAKAAKLAPPPPQTKPATS